MIWWKYDSIKIRNQSVDFNKFTRKAFRPAQELNSKNDLKRSLIDSQTKQSSCFEQFTKLIRDKLDESGIEPGDTFGHQLNGQLNEDDVQLKNQSNSEFGHVDLFKNDHTSNQLSKLRTGQANDKTMRLTKPSRVDDLNEYFLDLVLLTRTALKLCSESNKAAFKEQNLIRFLPEEHDVLNESSNIPNDIRYLNDLSKERLLIYKDQLEQTIKKLNGDLVDELETRDSIYLRRDQLFIQIESLTKSW